MSSSDPRNEDATDLPLVDGLARMSFEVMGRLTLLAAEEDLSLTQLRMLAVLRGRRPRMAELANALGLDRSSVTGLVRRAEQRGLVERSRTEGDGRGVQIELTEEGRRFAEQVTAAVARRLEPLTAPLDPPARRRLGRLLSLMLPAEDQPSATV